VPSGLVLCELLRELVAFQVDVKVGLAVAFGVATNVGVDDPVRAAVRDAVWVDVRVSVMGRKAVAVAVAAGLLVTVLLIGGVTVLVVDWSMEWDGVLRRDSVTVCEHEEVGMCDEVQARDLLGALRV